MFRLVESALESGKPFGIETTLSGRTIFHTIRQARILGYEIALMYIGTQNVETNLARIALRVRLGGHDVAEVDVRRRFKRSFANLPEAMKLSDFTVLIDNDSDVPGLEFQLLAIDQVGQSEVFGPLPAWAGELQIPARDLKERQ